MRRVNDTLVIINVAKDESDDELEDFMLTMAEARKRKVKHVVCLLECDSDGEIWECPECIATCKRLVDCGFISLLDTAVGLLDSPRFEADIAESLGAFEVWKISEKLISGKVEYYDQDMFKKLWERFLEVLGKANEKTERFLTA